ncbi:MAG: hypothetical protein ACI84F_001788, partial [Pseudoalteromonas tetraodonis]
PYNAKRVLCDSETSEEVNITKVDTRRLYYQKFQILVSA